MESAPILRRERDVPRAARPTLFQRAWLPAKPARTLLIVHGFGEHSGCYELLATWFARRGCAVHAFDQRGHGLSGGARLHARRFDDYLDDLSEVMGAAAAECPEQPLYLVGHDLGALVSALFLQEREPKVAGALLSRMPLSRPAARSPLCTLYAKLLGSVAPRSRPRTGLGDAVLYADPEVVSACAEDPLAQGARMTASLRAQSLRAMERVRASALGRPVLLLEGERDTDSDPSAAQRFSEEAPQTQLRSYRGLPRSIFHALGRETVFADMLAWLREREEKTT